MTARPQGLPRLQLSWKSHPLRSLLRRRRMATELGFQAGANLGSLITTPTFFGYLMTRSGAKRRRLGLFRPCQWLITGSLLAHLATTPAFSLEIWTSSEAVADAVAESSRGFEQVFNEPVNVTVLSKDLTSQFKTAAVVGKGPDILTWAHDVVGELAASGLLEPILMPQSDQDQFLSVAIKAFSYNGTLYGYPYDVEAIAFITNKILMPELPDSMEQLASWALQRQKTDPKHYTFLYDINNFFFTFPLLSAQGGYIFGDHQGGLDPKDIGLANPGAVLGAQFIQNLVQQGIVPSSTDRPIAFDRMKRGELAATIDGPWAIKELKAAGIPYRVSALPTLGGQRPRPFVGSHGFMIRRHGDKADLAKELIERYLVSKAGILNLYRRDPRGPSRKDALAALTVSDPDLRGFLASAAEGIAMPNIPEMGAVWTSAGQSLQLLTTGKAKPPIAMNGLVKMIHKSMQ